MDASRFDRLSRLVASANSRRTLVQTAAALSLAAIPALQGDDADAKQRGKRKGVGAEHWSKKKRFYCLDGETIRRYRRKEEKLLARGATLGKCGDAPCVPTTCEAMNSICGPTPDGCGGVLECGTCAGGESDTCCEGQCVDILSDDFNCGSCGNVCPEGETCVEGGCGLT